MTKSPYLPTPRSDGFFKPMFPSSSRGDGLVRANSAKTGKGQGKGGTHQRGHCKQCRAVNDFKAIDTSGGSNNGNGARGTVTKTTATGTLLGGGSCTETYGAAALKKGGGCWLCHSKNSR